MKKIINIIVLLLAATFLFCSCQKKSLSCEELLHIGLEYGIDSYFDSGYIFLKNDDKSSVFFMPLKTKETMYGQKFIDALEATKDFAIYVSSSSPYEMAIFECYSRNDTDILLQMCYERADVLKVGLRFSEWENASKLIDIQVYKNYVIFVFTDSESRNEGTIESIKALLR